MKIRTRVLLAALALLFVGIGGCTKTIEDAESLYRNGQEEEALDVAEKLMENSVTTAPESSSSLH